MSRARRAAGPGGDWPLALFTALAGVGAGLMLAPLASLAAGRGLTAAAPLAWRGLFLVAAGLGVSLAHLGRPLRALRAARNVGQSRLSAEIVLALVTLAAAAASVALPSSAVTAAITALSAAAFLVSLGLVYALPGQRAWRGPAVASPLSMALPLAVLAFAALGAEPRGSWRASAAVLLAIDLALFAWRARRLTSMPSGYRPVHPEPFRHRGVLLGLRFSLVTLGPLLFAARGRPFPAMTALALGILVDRAGFYALAVRHTTEADLAAAEDVIR